MSSAAVLVLAGLALVAAAAASPADLQHDEEAWLRRFVLEEVSKTEPLEPSEGEPLGTRAFVSTPIMIAKHGYPSETHTIRTEDGYLLGLHRIPNLGKPAVLLQHGILSSSADWVVIGKNKALAFLLYEAGYDVWLGNTRGNHYSRDHADISPDDGKFWNFSWHEMGLYDIPATIDHILNTTGQRDLVYIGHSQGTTVFFVMASMRPEYNQKVRAMIALGPVAYLNKIRSYPLKLLSYGVNQVAWITDLIGINEFMPNMKFLSWLNSKLCSDGAITQKLCTNILFLIAGFDSEQLDTTLLPEIMDNIPAGGATKQFIHFGQLIRAGDIFRQYDYGWIGNLKRYGKFSPPEYPLEKITTPVYLYYGENDLLAVPSAANLLHQNLPSAKGRLFSVPFEKFNHLDFLYAKDSKALLYDKVIEFVRDHSEN